MSSTNESAEGSQSVADENHCQQTVYTEGENEGILFQESNPQASSTASCAEVVSPTVTLVIGSVKNLHVSNTENETKNADKPHCKTHRQQTLEFLCTKCEFYICVHCKLSEHEGHPARSIDIIAEESVQRIIDASHNRLFIFKERLSNARKNLEENRKSFCNKKKEIEDQIHRQHAILNQLIDAERDRALRELENMAEITEAAFNTDDARLEMELKHVTDIQHRICETLQIAKSALDVTELDKHLKNKWDLESIMNRRSRALPQYSYQLEHKQLKRKVKKNDNDRLKQYVTQFMGSSKVTKIYLKKMPVTSKATPMFCCCNDLNSYVVSVCPLVCGRIVVSFTTTLDHDKGELKSFFQNGQLYKSLGHGLSTVLRCSKSDNLTYPMSYIRRNLLKLFNVRILLPKTLFYGLFMLTDECLVRPVCLSPLGNIWASSSSRPVNVKSPLAFDLAVQQGRFLLVVVDVTSKYSPLETSLDKLDGRVVKTISYLNDGDIVNGLVKEHVYEPPNDDFVPSDVCFCKLNEDWVLLVADMGSHSVHVLDIVPAVTDGLPFEKVVFQRYLVADCDFLQRPTALNVDHIGRVWVACQGGQLLTVETVDAREH